MVPTIVHAIGSWMDQFSESLDRWEATLCDLRAAYLRGDQDAIAELCRQGETVQHSIAEGKQQRSDLLAQAASLGYRAATIKDLSVQLDSQWPALWTHRIQSMEQQLARIQQLSISLWVTAFQAREFVSDLIRVLATGRSSPATYAPTESHSHEGGYLVNEAA